MSKKAWQKKDEQAIQQLIQAELQKEQPGGIFPVHKLFAASMELELRRRAQEKTRKRLRVVKGGQ